MMLCAAISQKTELFIFISYFAILICIAFLSCRKQKSETDYILGNRSLNFWLTALSAHASDMGSWLFLGYPALIFTTGVSGAWAAIGLTGCMFLNWQFIAPRIRTITEQTNSLTLSAYFENRFADRSGTIRIISAFMSVLFFIFYISSGVVAMGIIVESLFGLNYIIGISIGIIVVTSYVLTGGYRTIAWIDLVQGFFLLAVILIIPIILLNKIGGFSPIREALSLQNLSSSLLPNFQLSTITSQLFIALGWGLGYFGQPHILTKFMGIGKVSDMNKAKYLGIGWQAITLTSATFIGLIGIFFFSQELQNPERVTLDLVKNTMPTIFSGLVLCAILAATTNVMAAQILVVASNFSEDFYKRLIRRKASSKELLWVSRSSVLLTSFIAFIIAFFKISSIYQLVFYSWSGLGASFGPLLLVSLYQKNLTKQGAITGILVGGFSSAIWYYYNEIYHLHIPALIIGFILSLVAIETISLLTHKQSFEVHDE